MSSFIGWCQLSIVPSGLRWALADIWGESFFIVFTKQHERSHCARWWNAKSQPSSRQDTNSLQNGCSVSQSTNHDCFVFSQPIPGLACSQTSPAVHWLWERLAAGQWLCWNISPNRGLDWCWMCQCHNVYHEGTMLSAVQSILVWDLAAVETW